jgi:uncharacterized protein (DUF488 family)
LEIYTLGFAGKSAEQFFEALKGARIERVLDTRLHNTSQLAAFTKRRDLPFFLREICGAEYEHNLMLAPTDALLSAYKSRRLSWEEYAASFSELLRTRAVEDALRPTDFAVRTALLCTENKPTHCHRRLVAEYLATAWGNSEAIHL